MTAGEVKTNVIKKTSGLSRQMEEPLLRDSATERTQEERAILEEHMGRAVLPGGILTV